MKMQKTCLVVSATTPTHAPGIGNYLDMCSGDVVAILLAQDINHDRERGASTASHRLHAGGVGEHLLSCFDNSHNSTAKPMQMAEK